MTTYVTLPDRTSGAFRGEHGGGHGLQCSVCRHQVSVTAGAILHGTKRPHRIWFLAKQRLMQAKHSMLGLEFSRQLGVSQTTAWALNHKLTQVMMERERGWRPNGQQATIFGIYNHCTCELLGVHAVLEANRSEGDRVRAFSGEALDPSSSCCRRACSPSW